MPAHVAGQRVQHVAVGPGGLHIGLAEQHIEAVDVSAQGRQFGAGNPERGDVFGLAVMRIDSLTLAACQAL